MEGYYNDPEATEKCMGDGWFHTGDAAVVHPDGYVQITDRLKDVIISGGENISSVEVEAMLLRHDAIQEVAVVGVPHEKWGEAPHAFVVFKSGQSATPEALRAVLPRATWRTSRCRTRSRRSPSCRRRRRERFRSSCCERDARTSPPSSTRRADTVAITIAGHTPCVNRENPDARIAVSSRQPCAASADTAAIANSGGNRGIAKCGDDADQRDRRRPDRDDVNRPLQVTHPRRSLERERLARIEREGEVLERHRPV